MHLHKFILILIAAALTACSPQKRLSRLLKRYPELVATQTVKITDTIRVPGAAADTVFAAGQRDTIRLTNNRLEIRYFEQPGGKIYLAGKCKDTTIIRTVSAPARVLKVYRESWRPLWLALAAVSAGFLLLLIQRRKTVSYLSINPPADRQ